MTAANAWRDRLEKDGYVFVPSVFTLSEVDRLREAAFRAAVRSNG